MYEGVGGGYEWIFVVLLLEVVGVVFRVDVLFGVFVFFLVLCRVWLVRVRKMLFRVGGIFVVWWMRMLVVLSLCMIIGSS